MWRISWFKHLLNIKTFTLSDAVNSAFKLACKLVRWLQGVVLLLRQVAVPSVRPHRNANITPCGMEAEIGKTSMFVYVLWIFTSTRDVFRSCDATFSVLRRTLMFGSCAHPEALRDLMSDDHTLYCKWLSQLTADKPGYSESAAPPSPNIVVCPPSLSLWLWIISLAAACSQLDWWRKSSQWKQKLWGLSTQPMSGGQMGS